MSDRPNIIESTSPDPVGRLVGAFKAIDDIISEDSFYCSRVQDQDELTLGDLQREFNLYIIQIVAMIVDLFNDFTGDSCAVCIKTFNFTDDRPDLHAVSNATHGAQPPYVRTFWRDRASQEARNQPVDKDQNLGTYRHDGNTGLSNANKKGYWFCNDLTNLGKGYRRSNKLWSRFYNATAIVSLAYRSEGQAIHPMGFLCVDNMRGGFDDQACRSILDILANILHYTMRMTLSVSLKLEK